VTVNISQLSIARIAMSRIFDVPYDTRGMQLRMITSDRNNVRRNV